MKSNNINQYTIDGPAIEGNNGYKRWYIDGQKHRLHHHAIEYVNTSKAWYVLNLNISKLVDILKINKSLYTIIFIK